MQPSPPLLGSVLITGGCGFLGYTLVDQLLRDPECGTIHVIDRVISHNRHDGVSYSQGSITDRVLMRQVFDDVQPTVVFHLASPNFSFPTKGRGDFYETNVEGTKLLLELSAESPSVKAFVHCSSVDIYASAPHVQVDETHPTLTSYHEEYARTKALADNIVLGANGKQLRTVSLRLAHMYGTRDSQQLRVLLDMCAGNKPLFQLGPGTNLLSVISVDNAAEAHILAAKALVDPTRCKKGKADGEAFNISDGDPVLFWYHTGLFWSTARGRPVRDELIVIPEWLARLVIGIVQWVVWIFTLGYIEPPTSASSTALSFALEHRTYSSAKARERLGFEPKANNDEVIRRCVMEELRRRETKNESKG